LLGIFLVPRPAMLRAGLPLCFQKISYLVSMVSSIPSVVPILLSMVAVGVWQESRAANSPRSQGPEAKDKQAVSTVRARLVKISMADGMRFDPPRIEAKPGESLMLRLENLDSSHQPHNFLVVAPGQVQVVVREGLELGEKGALSGFIPKHPAVLASTGKVVDPDGHFELPFTVPAEHGVYGYVCTVPGHGLLMYGALYVGITMPQLSKDPNIPQVTLEKGLAGGGRRPFVQRMFLPNSGPAAIGVALPGAQNICFDAGACRLRYAWSGPFFDGTQYWQGNGSVVGELGADPWWVSSEFPLKMEGSDLTRVKFLGYNLVDGIPEFHYRAGEHEVFESVVASGDGVEIRLRVPTASGQVSYQLDSGRYKWRSPQGRSVGRQIVIPALESKRFSIFVEPAPEVGK
jgi:azurin